MIKQVFLLHPINFVSKTLKEYAKFAEVQLYILDEHKDFAYLINDLLPEVVLIHADSISTKEMQDELLSEFKNTEFKDFKFILLGDDSKLENEELKSFIFKKITEKIEPRNFYSDLEGLIK